MKLSLRFLLLLCVYISVQAPSFAQQTLNLTVSEQAFLDKIDEIHLCTDPDWMPYEGIDKSGHYTGIMSSFHQLWSSMIGKPVVLVKTVSWDQSLEFIQQKKCDVLSSAQDIPERRDYLTVTKPYIIYSLALATHPDIPFIINLSQVKDKKFVMVRDYAAIKLIRDNYPGLNIIEAGSAVEGLKLVERGMAFAFIDTVPSINYQMLAHGISHLKISGVLNEQYNMSVGIRKDLPLLLSIYNKAINATSEAQRQQILNNWLSVKLEYDADYSLLWKLLAGLFIILLLSLYRYRVVHRHNRELKAVNKKLVYMSQNDQLTGLPNRYYLHEAFQEALQTYHRYQHQFSVIIMDIDHFKKVNDTYGHVIGDQVIKKIADMLSENLRDTDIVGRWGGEEFLIVCPETNNHGAKAVAEHMRRLIEDTDFGLDDLQVTASFGVTEYNEDEAVDDCIKRADMALYRAKELGRNTTIVF